MAFKRDWFTNEIVEYKSECIGRQIIASEDTSHMVGGRTDAYNKPWQSEALAVPIDQMASFNEAAKRAGTGARYVPGRDGRYATLVCESRSSRAREMQSRGVFDKDAGYKDYAGGF